MRIKKLYIYIALVLVIIVAGYAFMNRPTYPVIVTPKDVLGTEGAPILIEEFSDLNCPACKAAHPTVKSIMDQYGDRVQFKLYHYPLVQIHPYAFHAALASECANDQEQFWPYIDAVFAAGTPNKGQLKSIAKEMGLDTASFNACLDTEAKRQVIIDDMNEGDKRRIRGTPTFFLNGKEMPSATFTAFQEAIEGSS